MGHLHMRRQGMKSTRNRIPDIYLEDRCKTSVVFFTTMDSNPTKEGKFYSYLCVRFPITPKKVNKYIYVIYIYYCNAIIKTATKNRSDKEMIRAFTELTTYLKAA